jgi:hypothetical protein
MAEYLFSATNFLTMFLKPFLSILLSFACIISFAQNGYWQQRADYSIEIKFDHKKHIFNAVQQITYTNNSPDTLHRLFLHLYFNAFQPGSMMDARSRSIKDPDERVSSRIFTLKPDEQGYHSIRNFQINGRNAALEVSGTVAEVKMPTPLLPGQRCVLDMEYEAQVPVQIRRSGRNNEEGIAYSMTQWYPKLAAYDREGWSAMPYVGREFHGNFGSFEVSITMDSAFTIGSTGVLQNPEQIGKGYSLNGKSLQRPAGKELTWKFKAERVHDFAWAADPDYRHDMFVMKNGTELHFFYKNDTSILENWKRLQPLTAAFFELANGRFGAYSYPQFSVIQGGDGGMEYPMATLISGTGSMGGLLSVTVHEALHNWYYGMLATNESRYPWMDEGFTTFAQDVILDILYGRNSVNPHKRAYRNYLGILNEETPEPLSTPADFYHTNAMYGAGAYSKGVVFLKQLEYIVGSDAFNAGLRRYFEEWKFKHPTPTDFRLIMEKESGMLLDRYFDLFLGTNKTVDYAIESVETIKGKSRIMLENKGQMPMPVELAIIDKDSNLTLHYIPMDGMYGEKPFNENLKVVRHRPWPWTHPYYELEVPLKREDIIAISLNPEGHIADIDDSNEGMPTPKPVFIEREGK